MTYSPASTELWYFAAAFALGAMGSLFIQWRQKRQESFVDIFMAANANGMVSLLLMLFGWHFVGQYPLFWLSVCAVTGIGSEAGKQKTLAAIRNFGIESILVVIRNALNRNRGDGNGAE